MVSSNFQERFNWEKTRKNMNENNAFCLLFNGCFTQSSQYHISKANTYSILTNGNRTWTRISTGISKFYEPSDSEPKFNKRRIKNWLSISFKLGSPWMRTCSHNHCTMFNIQYDGESESSIYPSSKSWNNPGDLSLPLNCASTLKIHTQSPK